MDGVVTHFGAPYCIRTEVLYGYIHTDTVAYLRSADMYSTFRVERNHVILIQGYKQMRITSFTNFYSDTSSVMARQICSEI